MSRNERDMEEIVGRNFDRFWEQYRLGQISQLDSFLYRDAYRLDFPTLRAPVENEGSSFAFPQTTQFVIADIPPDQEQLAFAMSRWPQETRTEPRRTTMQWTAEQFEENVELFGNRWGLTNEQIDALTMQDFHESLRRENLSLLRESIRENSDCSCGDPYCRAFHENIALEPYFERLQQQGATMTNSTAAAAAATTANTAPSRSSEPPRQELHISHQLDWTRNEWCQNGGRLRVKEWVLGQLRGEYPEWSCPFPVALYINGDPCIVQGGYWEGRGRRDRQVFVGLFAPDTGTRNRQFEIATTLAIAGVFGLQADDEIVTETERAIARMLSGIVTTLTSGLINTQGSVSQIAMNGSQLAARIDGVWRASNGSVIDVTTEGWVTFDYRQ